METEDQTRLLHQRLPPCISEALEELTFSRGTSSPLRRQQAEPCDARVRKPRVMLDETRSHLKRLLAARYHQEPAKGSLRKTPLPIPDVEPYGRVVRNDTHV